MVHILLLFILILSTNALCYSMGYHSGTLHILNTIQKKLEELDMEESQTNNFEK